MEWVASTLTPPPNMVYPALLKLMRTPRLPAVDWTDAPHRFKWTRPFRGKKKSGFCACAITFRTSYNAKIRNQFVNILEMFKINLQQKIIKICCVTVSCALTILLPLRVPDVTALKFCSVRRSNVPEEVNRMNGSWWSLGTRLSLWARSLCRL